MRRVLLLFVMLCLCAASAFPQGRVISGQVKDEKGKPVPFASVSVRNPVSGQNENGVSADQNGNFRIEVKNASLIVVSSAGYATKEVPLTKNSSILSVELGTTTQVIDEVVVTALGIRRNRNLLPYAAQQISGEDVSATRSNNFVSQLSGKVSGIEIRQGNGMGSSTNVVVRGTKSLLNNNQALFVIDGVPVDNSNTTSDATAQGRAVDANQRTQTGTYDYGNAAADINPDDIESVTVLKGAASTALYGSRAANGVVMITTKKTRKGLGITVNSGVTMSQIDKSTFTKYQKLYGAGYSSNYSTAASGSPNLLFWYKDAFGTGTKSLIVPTTEDASYGAPYDPSLMVYQWDSFDPSSPYYKKMKPWVAAQNDPSSFYQTGWSTNNSVSMSGGDDRTGFKIGYTRNEEKGVLPNSKLIKNLVNLGANYKITDRLTASASLNFSRVDGRGRYGTGYTKYNVNQSFRQWWETNVDIKELQDAYMRSKQNITWNWADPTVPSGLKPIYSDNPYFIRYQNYETDNRYRYIGNTSLNYKVTDWLNILGRISLDYYSEGHQERVATGSVGVSSYGQYNHTFRELNYDLLANFDKNITDDINLKALVGTNMRRTSNGSLFTATNGGLVVPNLFALSNSLNPLNVLPVDEVSQEIAVDGYFGGLTLGYQNFLTLDVTGRYDRASTLPLNNNAYFYPSVSGSFLFSKFLDNATWLSTGKLRANYAEVGNSAPWGSLQDVYFKPVSFGSATLFSLPDIKNNPDLLPEKTRSKEIGLEMAFLKSRVGFDLTYYDTKSINQIIPVAVSTATGYSNKFVNAGTIQNRGIELSLYASPVKTGDFSWNINVNWTRNRNKVLALFGDSKNLQINPLGLQGGVSVNATLNQPYGTIQGKTWQLLNGQKLVDDKPTLANGAANANYGRYVVTSTTNNVIGNVNPDWTGGIYNTVKYKNLSLGFLVDMRKGGDVFSLDLYYGLATGVYPETAMLNDKGNPSRSPIAQGGGVIMPGVTSDGKPNTIRVENVYGTYGYSFNPAANFVYDASYVKLREVNLTYTLPNKLVNKVPAFKGIDLSLIGRNLWIIHKNLPYADPEDVITAGNIQGYQSGSYPTNRTMGLNLKLRF
ncbi:MAG: SusC/RagA family TonB-linked outer membrane protein [Williamsia sp.]|nr:SusC/RagA family TonB-linked outer membrane protein [Williamsia sp.]